jgi:RNA polymerase sigma-70 factor (sigma-E family)
VEAGERERFVAFALRCGPRWTRLARALVGDWHEAEDLVQVALAKAYVSWSRIEAADDPEAYARRILLNTVRSAQRRSRVRVVLTDRVPDRAVADPGMHADGLLDAIGRLPVGQRAVLVLRFYEDLTEAATAAALGISVGTVKSQTARALDRLRSCPDLSLERQS